MAYARAQIVRDPTTVERERAEGRRHLQTACEAYRRQYDAGRYFLHEHPAHCDSWNEPCIRELGKLPGVYWVQGPMCRFELKATDKQGCGFVRKETGWLTNFPRLAEKLQGACSNFGGREWHRHVQLTDGRAAVAAAYTPTLVKTVLRALGQQLIDDGELDKYLCAFAGPVLEETIPGGEDWF